MDPTGHHKCPYNREAMDDDTETGENSVTTKAEMGVMEPPAKQGLQAPEAGRARKGWSPRSAGGSTAPRIDTSVKE